MADSMIEYILGLIMGFVGGFIFAVIYIYYRSKKEAEKMMAGHKVIEMEETQAEPETPNIADAMKDLD